MRVAIIGLGYVGLPLAVSFAEAGCDVLGVDVDAGRVRDTAAGVSRVEDITDARLRESLPKIEVSEDARGVQDADAIVICVPTPLTAHREPDLGPLEAAASAIASVLRAGHLVVLESTTYPGTTTGFLRERLERPELRAGEDFALAFSPERVDPGRTDFTLRTTPKIVGGFTAACTDRAAALYERVCDEIVRVSSPEAAELTKLVENIFRSVNIAMVNELAILADRMDIDLWEVLEAAETKPYGYMRFDPGPGMGGHCLPIDPFYLSWRARDFDLPTEFIELAGKVNQHMPYYCVTRIQRLLNDGRLPVAGSRVLIVGVSYKPGVADLRESPALKLMELLRASGADLAYHDPHVERIASLGLASEPDPEAAAARSDLTVIVTAHPSVDHPALVSAAPRVLDLRNATAGIDGAAGVERL